MDVLLETMAKNKTEDTNDQYDKLKISLQILK